MEYTIENDQLAVTVSTHGAELVSAVNKADGAEMIWNADPRVWPRHAPILFPYVGKLKDGKYQLDGNTYTGGGHGFARDSEFTAIEVSEDRLSFCLTWNEETLKKFPRKFRLTVSFTLEGRTLRQQAEVTNLDDKEMRFGLGYHPDSEFPLMTGMKPRITSCGSTLPSIRRKYCMKEPLFPTTPGPMPSRALLSLSMTAFLTMTPSALKTWMPKLSA